MSSQWNRASNVNQLITNLGSPNQTPFKPKQVKKKQVEPAVVVTHYDVYLVGNNCYGGFGLSEQCFDWIVETYDKGTNVDTPSYYDHGRYDAQEIETDSLQPVKTLAENSIVVGCAHSLWVVAALIEKGSDFCAGRHAEPSLSVIRMPIEFPPEFVKQCLDRYEYDGIESYSIDKENLICKMIETDHIKTIEEAKRLLKLLRELPRKKVC